MLVLILARGQELCLLLQPLELHPTLVLPPQTYMHAQLLIVIDDEVIDVGVFHDEKKVTGDGLASVSLDSVVKGLLIDFLVFFSSKNKSPRKTFHGADKIEYWHLMAIMWANLCEHISSNFP